MFLFFAGLASVQALTWGDKGRRQKLDRLPFSSTGQGERDNPRIDIGGGEWPLMILSDAS